MELILGDRLAAVMVAGVATNGRMILMAAAPAIVQPLGVGDWLNYGGAVQL